MLEREGREGEGEGVKCDRKLVNYLIKAKRLEERELRRCMCLCTDECPDKNKRRSDDSNHQLR